MKGFTTWKMYSSAVVIFCCFYQGLSISLGRPLLLLSRPSSHPHPRENIPYTSRDSSKFLAKWSLFFEERRKGIPHQGDTIPPFSVAWLWNFTGDGRNGGHSILLPPSNVMHRTEGEKKEREMLIGNVLAEEREGKMSWVWWRSDSLSIEWAHSNIWGSKAADKISRFHNFHDKHGATQEEANTTALYLIPIKMPVPAYIFRW